MRDAPKMVTEREAVLRERAAWFAGARCYAPFQATDGDLRYNANHRYPLPKVTRPRVVADHEGFRWRIVGNERQFYNDALDGWRAAQLNGWDATNGRILIWADLLANPTEEVSDE